jgi:hypothetical protein
MSANGDVPEASTPKQGASTTWQVLLWIGGILIVLMAASHQARYVSSSAYIWFGIGTLVLLPPSRAIISKLVELTPTRTTFIVIGALFFGVGVMGVDETRKRDAEAVAKGYGSHTDMERAASLGLTSAADLAVHDAKAKADAEAAAAKASAEATERERQKDADCRAELRCWAEKHHISATVACRPRVERLAQYQFEWTDGWAETKFSRFRWKDKAKGQLTYVGDKIKFQNGFGAWQFYTYLCDYDPVANKVLDVDAMPGRLPE